MFLSFDRPPFSETWGKELKYFTCTTVTYPRLSVIWWERLSAFSSSTEDLLVRGVESEEFENWV